VAAMPELFLSCADGGFYDLGQILNIHGRIIPPPFRQFVLFG
jgi:hypothetical protein